MESHGASRESVGEDFEDLPIQSIKSERVDPEGGENPFGFFLVLDIVSDDLVIPEDFDEAVDDTGRPTTLFRYERVDSRISYFNIEEYKRSANNLTEIRYLVEIEFQHISEAVAKRSGDF